jgi:hypothetical protein
MSLFDSEDIDRELNKIERRLDSAAVIKDIKALERYNPEIDCEYGDTGCSSWPIMESTREYTDWRYPTKIKTEGNGEWVRLDDVLNLFNEK